MKELFQNISTFDSGYNLKNYLPADYSIYLASNYALIFECCNIRIYVIVIPDEKMPDPQAKYREKRESKEYVMCNACGNKFVSIKMVPQCFCGSRNCKIIEI